MLNLSLCMKTCLLKTTSDRNNLCYFPLKCSWHQETELFEKSKHLLKHTSLVSDSRFQFQKVTLKYVQHCLLLLDLMEPDEDNSAFILTALFRHFTAAQQNMSSGHAVITLCQPLRASRELPVQRKSCESAFAQNIPLGFPLLPISGVHQCLQNSGKQWHNKCQRQF